MIELNSLVLTFLQFDSPIGKLGLLYSKKGIRRLFFENEAPFIPKLKSLYPKDEIHSSTKDPHPFKKQILEYLNGERKIFSLPLDFQSSPFYTKALKEVAKIPYGETASYKDIAIRCDNPKAVRAVGSANAHNPIPLIIPCHRKLTHTGTLGGFGGGLMIKKYLLDLESQ